MSKITINNTISMEEFEAKYELLANVIAGKIPAYTHCGRFHSDEVYCTAGIILARNIIKASEGSVMPVAVTPEMVKNCGVKRIIAVAKEEGLAEKVAAGKAFVFDLAGGQADHHVPAKRIMRDMDIPEGSPLNKFKPYYCSFGVIWNLLGLGELFDVTSPKAMSVKDTIDRNLVFPIDMVDNHGPNCPATPTNVWSNIISAYNGMDDAAIDSSIVLTDEEKLKTGMTRQFIKAVMAAYETLYNLIAETQSTVNGVNYIVDNDLVKINKNGVSYIDIPAAEKPIRINTVAAAAVTNKDGTTAKFILNRNPSERDGTFSVVCTDSVQAWLNEAYLEEANKPVGMKFVHPNLFMSTFDTVENAVAFADNCKVDNGQITL